LVFASLITGSVSVETRGIERHGQRLAMTLTGHQREVTSVAYTPGGRLLSGSCDGTVRIWDTRTGEESMCLVCGSDESVNCVAVASTGTSIAAGTLTGDLYTWDLQTVQRPPLRLLGHSEMITSIAFSLDGSLIASASADNSLRLWRVTTGRQIAVLRGHTRPVLTVAFSPDRRTIASGSLDGTLRLWTNITGQPTELYVCKHNTSVESVHFSPDGKRLAMGSSNGGVHLWDVMTKSNTETLRGHTSIVRSIQFSPDGSSLVSASYDRTVRLWNQHQSVILSGHSGSVYSATFSPDGLYIASGSQDTTIRIWDAGISQQAARPLEAPEYPIMSIAVSNDRALIATLCLEGTERVWDAQTGGLKYLRPGEDDFTALAISPDACIAASLIREVQLQLWDLNTGDRVGKPLRNQKRRAEIVVFSPDRKLVASEYSDGIIHIWNVATQRPLKISPLICQQGAGSTPPGSDDGDEEDYRKPIITIEFSPDGQQLAAGDDKGNIHIWNMKTGQRLHEPLQETGDHTSGFCIAFSPNGLHIASSCADNIGHVWDIAAREQILSLVGHTSPIVSIAYSPGGTFIATGSRDHTVRLWDVETGRQLTTLHGHISDVISIACMSSNQSIVTGDWNSTIRVWDVETALAESHTEVHSPMSVFERGGLHDGWALGQAGELLLWVPDEYRAYLNPPSCRLLIAKYRVTITIGEVWHHGDDWTACWPAATSA